MISLVGTCMSSYSGDNRTTSGKPTRSDLVKTCVNISRGDAGGRSRTDLVEGRIIKH